MSAYSAHFLHISPYLYPKNAMFPFVQVLVGKLKGVFSLRFLMNEIQDLNARNLREPCHRIKTKMTFIKIKIIKKKKTKQNKVKTDMLKTLENG